MIARLFITLCTMGLSSRDRIEAVGLGNWGGEGVLLFPFGRGSGIEVLVIFTGIGMLVSWRGDWDFYRCCLLHTNTYKAHICYGVSVVGE